MIKDEIEELADRCAAARRLDLVVQMEVAKRLARVLDDEETPPYVLAQASRELRAIVRVVPLWVIDPSR